MSVDHNHAVRCMACHHMITEGAEALMPPDIPVRTWLYVCPRCGCQNYEDPPENQL